MHVKEGLLTVIRKPQCVGVPPTAAAPKEKQENSWICSRWWCRQPDRPAMRTINTLTPCTVTPTYSRLQPWPSRYPCQRCLAVFGGGWEGCCCSGAETRAVAAAMVTSWRALPALPLGHLQPGLCAHRGCWQSRPALGRPRS